MLRKYRVSFRKKMDLIISAYSENHATSIARQKISNDILRHSDETIEFKAINCDLPIIEELEKSDLIIIRASRSASVNYPIILSLTEGDINVDTGVLVKKLYGFILKASSVEIVELAVAELDRIRVYDKIIIE